jgi:hypothetical protein
MVVAGFLPGYCTPMRPLAVPAALRGGHGRLSTPDLARNSHVRKSRIVQRTAVPALPDRRSDRRVLRREYGTATGETDVIDIDETISALAKTIADLTYGSDVRTRQRVRDD